MTAPAMPRLRVRTGAGVLDERAGSAVAAVRVRTRLAMPAQCLLTLDVGPGAPGQAVLPELGEALRLDVDGHDEPLFEGEVTAVEDVCAPDGARSVRVRAYDRLHRLRQRQSSRVHENVGLTDLAVALCAGTGLTVDGPARPQWERLYQTGESDLQLLRDTAGRCGWFPVVEAGVLHLVDLAGRGEPVELVLGENLHSASVERNADPGFSSVHAHGWAAATAEGGTATGAVAAPAPPGGGDLLLLGGVAAEDELEAQVRAQQAWVAASRVSASAVAAGHTGLRAGRRVKLVRTGTPLPAPLVLTDVVHVLDRSGWTASLSTAPPAVPARSAGSAVTLGTVSAVDDPAGAGRVRVLLSAYADLLTGWVSVVVPGGAEGQGAVLLPDVGDRVAVLLPQGDPAHALVLGGLLGGAAPGDPGVEAGRVRRWTLGNRTGQALVLDAAAERLVLRGHNGSVVELGADVLRIRAATDLVLEAPGRAVTVRARSVDFQEAP